MHVEAARYLAHMAHRRLLGAKTPFCGDRIYAILRPILIDLRDKTPDALDNWRAMLSGIAPIEEDTTPNFEDTLPEAIVDHLGHQTRRDGGIYPTPTDLADAMAGQIVGEAGEVVLDLSAGAATLLASAIRRAPHLRAIGVELNPTMALAGAINLAATRGELGGASARSANIGDRIYIGDGLRADAPWSQWEGRAAAVLGNPPYLREKGHRDFFRRLKTRHPHLEKYFGARMDLQYLFFHQSASFLHAGGRLVFVTSAYWLSATHARALREDLSTRLSPEVLVRVEKGGIFADAPGQHTLLSVFQRCDKASCNLPRLRAISLPNAPDDWDALLARAQSGTTKIEDNSPRFFEHETAQLGADNWSVFSNAGTLRWGRHLRDTLPALREFLSDRQGFVSGADRFTTRHRKFYASSSENTADPVQELPEKGAPIFLFEGPAQIPPSLAPIAASRASALRPVLRARHLTPNAVYFTPPSDELALYIDGPLSASNEAVVAEHLQPFRPVLERRREVKTGTMPWYRLHWPRSRAEQVGPKLVVPRRAPKPRFALDLAGQMISSDCTYLVAQPADSLEDLVRLMVLLNSDFCARYLQNFGKSKGKQLEFYSEPLRALPLPIMRGEDGRLTWLECLGGDYGAENDAWREERRQCAEVFQECTSMLIKDVANPITPAKHVNCDRG